MMFPSELARRGRGEDLGHLSLPKGGPEAGASITLRIVNTRRRDAPAEVVTFARPRVTIGRSRKCDHRLDDQKQVVSGRHAQIAIEGGKLFVTDLASRNFTYVDGERLEPNAPHEISAGSTVTIAEFEIQADAGGVAGESTEAPTVFEASYENPFTDEAVRLAALVGRIDELYESEAPGRRNEALREALDEALSDAKAGGAWQVLARALDRDRGGEGPA